MLYEKDQNGKPVPWNPAEPREIPKSLRDPKVKDTHARLPRNIEKRWSHEELLLWKLYKPHDERVDPEDEDILIEDEITDFEKDDPDRLVTKYTTSERVIKKADVNKERDRRRSAGFMFKGKLIQSDPESARMIANFAQMARDAILGGKLPADTKWHGGPVEFTWTTADNSDLVLSAGDMIAMSKACTLHEAHLIKRARKIKQKDPIPKNYNKDRRWEKDK